MAETSSYPNGTPSWTDLASPDIDGAARFYGDLFGWENVATGTVEETGGYRFFTRDGQRVAGVGPVQGDGAPPAWTTYFSVDDADATAERIPGAGGTLVVEPFDVLDAGRMAVFSDAVGAVAGLWQPGAHRGAETVNEPNTMTWNELACRDTEAAQAFYAQVFDWRGETDVTSGDRPYTTWTLDGRPIGGMITMDALWEGIPEHWMTYFAVADTDVTARRAAELGGTVHVPPTDIPVGRFSVVGDPHGAVFSVIRLSGPL